MDDPNNRNSVRCTATCADRSPCHSRATVGPWAVRGTDPPRGAPHSGGRASVGVPRGNQSIWSHAFYARPGPSSALRQTRRSSNEGILVPQKKRAHGAWHLSKTPFKRAKLSQCLAPALRKLLSVILVPQKKGWEWEKQETISPFPQRGARSPRRHG
jgi:hypothetical protein